MICKAPINTKYRKIGMSTNVGQLVLPEAGHSWKSRSGTVMDDLDSSPVLHWSRHLVTCDIILRRVRLCLHVPNNKERGGKEREEELISGVQLVGSCELLPPSRKPPSGMNCRSRNTHLPRYAVKWPSKMNNAWKGAAMVS